jgi:N-acetylglucosaminyldiphosphoundecaprenol N-acetyl-beta-D-mannosaminyltransferase
MTARQIVAGGVKVDLTSTGGLIGCIGARLTARGPRPLVVASANLDHIYHFGRGGRWPDPAVGEAADWLVTADGMPVVWVARHITRNRCEQLAGSDLLPTVLGLAQSNGSQVGFLGGWPDQHARLDRVLGREFPRLAVAGYWAPPRGHLEDPCASRALSEDIAAAKVDLLVAGLGKPTQELWLSTYAVNTGASVVLAFGAAADFMAGTAVRAPRPIRSMGLEWAFRLGREPRRLARRYLVQGPRALWRLLRWSHPTGP